MKKLRDAVLELDVSLSWLNKKIRVIWLGGVRRIPDHEMERIKKEGVK